MIETHSFIILLICFFTTAILSEKYFTKNPPRFSIFKAMGAICIVLVALTMVIVALPIMIEPIAYIMVIAGTIVCIYVRHRSDQNNGWH
jgi:Flp pilus assembly protein TadB